MKNRVLVLSALIAGTATLLWLARSSSNHQPTDPSPPEPAAPSQNGNVAIPRSQIAAALGQLIENSTSPTNKTMSAQNELSDAIRAAAAELFVRARSVRREV